MTLFQSPEAPLVIQLQKAALDNGASVSSILLKAKLVAAKLGLAGADIAHWIGHELGGYAGSNAALPSYRILSGHPLAVNPYRGEIPVQVGHPAPDALLSALFELRFPNALPEIEALVAGGNAAKLRVPFPPELQQLVSELTGHDFALRWAIGPGQLAGVIEAVRSRTMQWALDLEAGGVLGADFQFTLTERDAAMTITNNFTNSNIGNVGDVSHGGQVINNQTINNAVPIDKLTSFLDQLEVALPGLPAPLATELAGPIEILSCEVEADAPEQGRIRSALGSIRAACEGAAGNLVAAGILALTTALLG